MKLSDLATVIFTLYILFLTGTGLAFLGELALKFWQ